MDKIELVEESYRNGEIVIYEEGEDNIYVCFGETKIDQKNKTITFTDCSIAMVSEGDTKYYGEVFRESYDLTFYVSEGIPNEMFIPTRFTEGELVERRVR